jgi:hypothetical protein
VKLTPTVKKILLAAFLKEHPEFAEAVGGDQERRNLPNRPREAIKKLHPNGKQL